MITKEFYNFTFTGIGPVEPPYKYINTEKGSIWGEGDKKFLKFFKSIKLHGRILNGGSGDGRYNDKLLEQTDRVVAADVDPNPLRKLYNNTPLKDRQKLDINVFDITKRFPYKDESFDGFFSTGLLHIFPEEIFEKISHEIHRVLKPKGRVILSFPTDMTRTKPDGEHHIYDGEPAYSLTEGEKLLKKLFQNKYFDIIEMQRSYYSEDTFRQSDTPYKLNCNYIFVNAIKN